MLHPSSRTHGRRWATCGSLATVLFLSAGATRAQVNTEKLRGDEVKAGWSGAVDGALSFRAGSQDLIETGSELRLRWQRLDSAAGEKPTEDDLRNLFLLAASVRFGREQGRAFQDSGFAHLRWTHRCRPAFAAELFTQAEYDRFLLLESRLLLGASARFRLRDRPGLFAAAGIGLMGERERLDLPPGSAEPAASTVVRSTSYLTVRLAAFDGRLHLVNTLYAQPLVDDPGDFQLLDEAELEISLSEHLSLAVAFHGRYDNRPPDDLEPPDATLENKLRYRF